MNQNDKQTKAGGCNTSSKIQKRTIEMIETAELFDDYLVIVTTRDTFHIHVASKMRVILIWVILHILFLDSRGLLSGFRWYIKIAVNQETRQMSGSRDNGRFQKVEEDKNIKIKI